MAVTTFVPRGSKEIFALAACPASSISESKAVSLMKNWMEPVALAGVTAATKCTPSLKPHGFADDASAIVEVSRFTASTATALVLAPPDAVTTTEHTSELQSLRH